MVTVSLGDSQIGEMSSSMVAGIRGWGTCAWTNSWWRWIVTLRYSPGIRWSWWGGTEYRETAGERPAATDRAQGAHTGCYPCRCVPSAGAVGVQYGGTRSVHRCALDGYLLFHVRGADLCVGEVSIHSASSQASGAT